MKKLQIASLILLILIFSLLLYMCVVMETQKNVWEQYRTTEATSAKTKEDNLTNWTLPEEEVRDTAPSMTENNATEPTVSSAPGTESPETEPPATEEPNIQPSIQETPDSEETTEVPPTEWNDSFYTGDL